MPPFPIPLETTFGSVAAYAIFLAIGFSFGFVLEIAGFADSPRLAAQFYFRDLTVLKVMFTSIVVAMVLIFGASAVGLLDYNLIWVNPTYLWPGIVGGLIMGVGFIVGGYCPGTSIVAAATARIDGVFFALGTAIGIFLFGETVSLYDVFWTSSYMGRLTLPEVFGLPVGLIMVLVVLMALFMFWGGEKLESAIGGVDLDRAPRARYAGAAGLMAAAVLVLLVGQPSLEDRWSWIAAESNPRILAREIQASPAEVLDKLHDHRLNIRLIDVRDEADFNLFHLSHAERIGRQELIERADEFVLDPPNTSYVLMSNGETLSTQAWKDLTALGVPNVYVLAGGINAWLDTFAHEDDGIASIASVTPPDQLRYQFPAAYGARFQAASPDPHHYEFDYVPVIEIKMKRGPLGSGCG